MYANALMAARSRAVVLGPSSFEARPSAEHLRMTGLMLGPRVRRSVLAAHLVEPLLQVVELALEVVHLGAAGGRCRLLCGFSRFAGAAGGPAERREHGEGLLEHLHVAADLIFHRADPGN